MFRFIFNMMVVGLISFPVFGQEGKLPLSFSGGVEIGNYFYSRLIENVDFREVTADFQVGRFLIVGDYGYAGFRQNEEFHDYFSEGKYFRIGADLNFIKKKSNPNVIFLGIRYAQSKFDETVTYSTNNGIEEFDIWPENTFTITNKEATGRWLELVGGLKVDVFKGFQLGITGRYKFLASDDSESTFLNYYLPGYGKRTKNSNWGLSYYVGYRFRF